MDETTSWGFFLAFFFCDFVVSFSPIIMASQISYFSSGSLRSILYCTSFGYDDSFYGIVNSFIVTGMELCFGFMMKNHIDYTGMF